MLLAGCHSPRLGTSPPPADITSARAPAATMLGRLHRQTSRDTAEGKRGAFQRFFASRSGGGASIGRGLAPRRSTGFKASLAYLSPDTINAGVFYTFNDRWTLGILGQRLEQERSVSVEGQLIDPNDLNSFIDSFTIRERVTSLTFGPFAQFRITRDQGDMPDLRVAAYALEFGSLTSAETQYSMPDLIIFRDQDAAKDGESADKFRTVFLSASKRLPMFRGSQFFVRAYAGAGVGFRTGKRYSTAQTGSGDPRIRVVRENLTRTSLVGWVGAELGLPANFRAYGEVFTGDECDAGFGVGVRWVSPIGITFTLGYTNCFEPIPQRALDLVFLPGGVGGQPSVPGGAGGIDSGSQGFIDVDDPPPGRGRGRTPPRPVAAPGTTTPVPTTQPGPNGIPPPPPPSRAP